jgi:hypothetical protein
MSPLFDRRGIPAHTNECVVDHDIEHTLRHLERDNLCVLSCDAASQYSCNIYMFNFIFTSRATKTPSVIKEIQLTKLCAMRSACCSRVREQGLRSIGYGRLYLRSFASLRMTDCAQDDSIAASRDPSLCSG